MLKKLPHTYVIIFYIIIFAALLTWIVPGGEFERETIVVNGSEKTVIAEDSFKHIPHEMQTWQIFEAMFAGFKDKADIIAFIFMVGGAFMIITKTRAIDSGVYGFLRFMNRIKKSKVFRRIEVDNIVITAIMLVFSLFGAIFGMSEETIPFVMIIIPLAISMGYDSITGVSLVFLAAGLGFAGALLNPFTIGVAQTIAGIEPLFSGIQYRLFAWAVINAVGIAYVLRYTKRLRKDPKSSLTYHEDAHWRESAQKSQTKAVPNKLGHARTVFGLLSIVLIIFSVLYYNTHIKIGSNINARLPLVPIISGLFVLSGIITLRKSSAYFVLQLLFFSILFLIVGVMGYGWYVSEIATLFFALGILSGAASGFSPNIITKHFLYGVKDIASAALIVGFAAGIIKILENGKIIDTILNEVSGSVTGVGKVGSISVMYLFQSLLNLFIPSGSGQAALTMPIMAPLSELLGISKQSAVMAFQFGDGFTNMITPTSGVLIGVLGVAKIPYDKWFKFIFPFMIIIFIVALLLLIPTVSMDLPGF